MSVYSNLAHKRKTKKDSEARKKATYLASLPKHPVKRTLYRLHPKRFWGFWFSKRGAITALKISGVALLFMVLVVGALFAYYRKDLDAIRPGELAKRVQTTVTTYYDRNGELLWRDKGSGNYKLVVDGEEISDHMKNATIAIEDQDFYKHNGVSPTGIVRAAINNVSGGDAQGGSTLTQQLVKQVFFEDEADERGLAGIPRKIKEMILSIEVERMYDKPQIIELYLNESPYGGRRNGVESAAQTYFSKSAKELGIAESALLASIPNQPGLYDPYNEAGHEALIARQHKTLNSMVELGFITQAESDEAKKMPILDNITPEASQYEGIKAPHFVQMVRAQLERELGKVTVGRGGLVVKTTLDLRIQEKLRESMTEMFQSGIPEYAGFTNGAATVEDVQTGQVVAMVGSRDFQYPGFGQDNAATAYIQPGSSIKPLVFAELFEQKPAGQRNYGSGTILKDEPIDDIYGAELQNADRRFKGNMMIRDSLAQSRNIPAVKAMYISGVTPTLETIRAMGDINYCTRGVEKQAGLSSAIGSCGTRQIDHVNAFASLARMGVYKPHSSVLEVRNNQNEVIKKWKDESKRVINAESAYIVNDILTDAAARQPLFGNATTGFSIPGVQTATKTGTSDIGGQAKDLWMMSYSPALSMGVWLGNSDTRTLNRSDSSLPGPIIADVMEFAHKEVYAPANKWQSGDWFTAPAGIQTINGELYPSWYNKSQGQTNAKLTFDRVSKKKATECTPDAARIEVDVLKSIDPVTKREIFISPDGYNATEEDDAHDCGDAKPSISGISVSQVGDSNQYRIEISARRGTFALEEITVSVGGQSIGTLSASASGDYETTYTANDSGQQTIAVNVRDDGYYSSSSSRSFMFDSGSDPGNSDELDD